MENNKYFIAYANNPDSNDTSQQAMQLWELNDKGNLIPCKIDSSNTITNGNHLIQVGNYILEWGPMNAKSAYPYQLFEFNPQLGGSGALLGSWDSSGNWTTTPVQEGDWVKSKFFGTRADFANPNGAKKGFEAGDNLLLLSTHNFVLNFIPTAGRGTYQLFNFDHASSDPLPQPYTPQGAWMEIQSGHELIYCHGYFIDWVPETSDFKLWQFDAASISPLSFPEALSGNWTAKGINKDHQLRAIGDYILDWNQSDNTYRIWEFDYEDPNLLKGPIGSGVMPDTFNSNTVLTPFETLYVSESTSDSNPAPGTMDFMREKIQHVVYYMIENRSLDHVLGWLYDNKDKINVVGPAGPYRGVDSSFTNDFTNQFSGIQRHSTGFFYCLTQDLTPYFGIGDKVTVQGTPGGINDGEHVLTQAYYDTSLDQTCLQWAGIQSTDSPSGHLVKAHPISLYNDGKLSTEITLDLDQQDPYHDNSDVLRQCFSGSYQDYKDKKTPDMGGFATNNGTLEVMQGYSPEQLPVLNGLAKNFAVSDDWFCSMPGGTDVNRAFALSGNSLNNLNNFQNGAQYAEWSEYPHRPSIWKVLWSNGITDFRIYNSIEWMECKFTYNLFLKGQIPYIDNEMVIETYAPSINQFYSDLDNGTLPKFSYLEPIWCATSGSTSYHPGNDLIPGERDLNRIYSAIQNSEYKDNTLLVITFDAHGGLPDHVPPPYAVNPYPNDSEQGFDFDMMGVRVPTILVSPYIAENTVFRADPTGQAYCSTSILSTLLNWFGIPRSRWGLGLRTDKSPTFENALTLASPRTDNVVLDNPYDQNFPPKNGSSEYTVKTENLKVNGIHELVVPRMIADMTPGISVAQRNKITEEILGNSKNVGEMHNKLDKLAKKGSLT